MFVATLLVVFLSACGSVDKIQSDEEVKAKTSDSSSETKKEDSKSDKEKEEAKEKDIWTYYDNAKWSEDFKGLKVSIEKIVVSDNAPGMDDDGNQITTSAVGAKFRIENTTTGKFTTYPDQATLVTSTGEQVEADMFTSDSLGGEIDEGVIKEGDVIFYLNRGHAEDIKWVKLSWMATTGGEADFDSEHKDFEVKLELK